MPAVSATVPLAGSERRRPDHHRHVGPLDPETRIGVTVVARARPGNPPPPDLAAWRATPLRQRKALRREDYAAHHGADPADLEAAERCAVSHGLNVAARHAGRRAIVLEGKPAGFGSAFGVKLQEYEAPVPSGGRRPGTARPSRDERPQTHRHHGHDGPLMAPAELSGIVLGIVGFDNRFRAVRAGSGGPPEGTLDPPGAQFSSVPTLARRYKLHNLISGRSAITPEMAVKLEKAIGGGADTWLRMQMNHDLAQVRKRQVSLKVRRLVRA